MTNWSRRLIIMLDQLYAVTLRQPWAWAIAHCGKRIENRTWSPRHSLIGQRIAIHAGKSMDEDGFRWLYKRKLITVPFPPAAHVRGAIVAVATYQGAVRQSDDPWFFGPVGWVLSDVVSLLAPVPCRGALGLWIVPDDVRIEIWSQLQDYALEGI